MKYSDGIWSMREGVTPHYPVHVHQVETEPDALTIYGPTRRLTQRGDTHDTPLVTVHFSSPMADVIRVRIYHHKGAPASKPEFELQAQPAPRVTIHDDAEKATLTSGGLTVRVEKAGDWMITFQDEDGPITSSGPRGMGFVDTDSPDYAHRRYVHEQLSLSVGECVYGLGERFTPFVKNGQSVDLWNKDGGTSTEQAYKNIPFYLTNRGYGVFVNHPERVSFEIASEKVSRVQFSVPGECLEYFLIYGPSPKEVLEKYTALTGRPALPPAWSFGLWLTTSFATDYDEKTITGIIQGMADRDLPLHVFHFDCFWMKAFHWCDFQWDAQTFPDPPGMLKRLHERGLRTCVWINPYIAQRSALFDEGAERGYLLKRPDGSVWQWDRWQAGMGIVDFTNPEARRWFCDKLHTLVNMGVDCFKTDFGERIPTDVVYFDGSDPVKMHNYYPYLYNKTVFQALEKAVGQGEAVLFARSATAGCQKFPVHWGGDSQSTFESMAESLRGGLSLGLSGFGFWSHDIGGFDGSPPADVYKRWLAFGLLSSHSRLHGSASYRVPWLFDQEAVDVLRLFTKLKCRLMPYLYAQAGVATRQGTPLLRAMMLEFPDDPACDPLDRQYMLGDSLLVAPVFSSNGIVTYYLPEGNWTNFLTGKTVQGPSWVSEQHAFTSLPLMVRPNSVIPIGSREDRPDYDYGDGVTLQMYALKEGARIRTIVPTSIGSMGAKFDVKRTGQTISVEPQGDCENWHISLIGIHSITSAQNGTAEADTHGIRVTPVDGAAHVSITL